jgi:hypothetical protein
LQRRILRTSLLDLSLTNVLLRREPEPRSG